MGDPLDAEDARRASRQLAEQHRVAERWLEQAVQEAANAETTYRRELSEAFIRSEGTASEREAKAKADSADAFKTREIAAGMIKVANKRLDGLEGERSMLKSLIDWSAKMMDDVRRGREFEAQQRGSR